MFCLKRIFCKKNVEDYKYYKNQDYQEYRYYKYYKCHKCAIIITNDLYFLMDKVFCSDKCRNSSFQNII